MVKALAVCLLLCLAAAAFALDLSVGGGMTVGHSWDCFQSDYTGPGLTALDILRTTVPFGFTAWFDATYGQASVGFRANGNTHEVLTMVILGTTTETPSDDNYSSGFLSLSLLGKYPFAIGGTSLFPLLGVEYDVILYYKDETGAAMDKTGLGQLWFKGGVGADFALLPKLLIRPEILLGFKLLNQGERADIQDALDAGATAASTVVTLLEAAVLVGYRF